MSAIIGGLIPKIEGFQPIPNAVMIPFMEAQSAALAYGFGLNYEYGKRKIRSMSNDEFNSLTSEDITNMSNEHTHIILSKFQAQVPNVMPMQSEIFKQYVIIEKAKVQQNFELAKWMLAYIKEIGDDTIAHLMGGHLHGEILEPYVTDPNKFINPITGEQGAEATPPPPPPESTTELFIDTNKEYESPEAPAYLTWLENVNLLKITWTTNKRLYDQYHSSSHQKTALESYIHNINASSGKLKTLSGDYRNPNDLIRQGVIRLRQEMADGKWHSVHSFQT